MLSQIINATRLNPDFCANLLRVPSDKFKEWMDGKAPLPRFLIPELSAVLGVSEKTLLARPASRTEDDSTLAPAIWFKLRSDQLSDADREFVGLVRRLGFFMGQLEAIRETRNSSAWRAVARTVFSEVDRSAPPAVQGKEAAKRFRAAASLEHGQTGAGELIRPRLRAIGLVVIESPIPKSSLEGCCFGIGREGAALACVFANTFKSTWFRRNEIIMHEVCHSIFDLESDPVPLDFRNDVESDPDIPEARARSFAQEALVPKSVLSHYTNSLGLKWESLGSDDVARLVSEVHVEQKTVLRAAFENGLISEHLRAAYTNYNCSDTLKQISPHAVGTKEFLRKQQEQSPKWLASNRKTTVGGRSLRLPAGYAQQIIEILNSGEISEAKAAEMLMMDRYTFDERFGSLIIAPVLA